MSTFNSTMDYTRVSEMLIKTENAIKDLKNYQAPQIQSSKENIIEQVCDYIQYTLNEANWQFKSADYYHHLALLPSNNWNNCVKLYIHNNRRIDGMISIADIFPDKIKFLDCQITNDMILELTQNWSYFKVCIHEEIKRFMEEKQKKLNQELQDMAAIQNALNNFEL